MAGHKIIFVSQEISPYLSVTENASWGRSLPQSIQGRKYEVRTFMPDFGDINERRNQLHEVIRLSGMNIGIGDSDHPLTVKVASMQPSRIQVYFIDNDDYFQKLASDIDAFGSNREDNDERIIFFARGTMETARKLRWEPAIMEVSGWMSAFVPLYLKALYKDGPNFLNTKLVYTILPDNGELSHLPGEVFDKLQIEGITPDHFESLVNETLDINFLHKMAILYSDAVVFQTPELDSSLTAYCDSIGKPWKHFTGEGDFADNYDELYKSLMTGDEN